MKLKKVKSIVEEIKTFKRTPLEDGEEQLLPDSREVLDNVQASFTRDSKRRKEMIKQNMKPAEEARKRLVKDTVEKRTNKIPKLTESAKGDKEELVDLLVVFGVVANKEFAKNIVSKLTEEEVKEWLKSFSEKRKYSFLYDNLREDDLKEATHKVGNKWVNKGKKGQVQGTFKTKKAAQDQVKAIYANKSESVKETLDEFEKYTKGEVGLATKEARAAFKAKLLARRKELSDKKALDIELKKEVESFEDMEKPVYDLTEEELEHTAR